MKALLLAAGYGKRLRPLTINTPKCLMPINGKPLLGIWLEQLNNANVTDILINTHYLSKKVNNYIEGSKFHANCTLVHEPKLLGTAGTLLTNFEQLKDHDVLVAHADNYIDANIQNFISAYQNRPKSTLFSMMTFRTKCPESAGIIKVNSQNIVTSFEEKPRIPNGNLANAAIYILSANFMKILLENMPFAKDFSTEIIPNYIGQIHAHAADGIVVDIGTVESYEALCETFS